jgi:hypothetical protein
MYILIYINAYVLIIIIYIKIIYVLIADAN